MLHQCSEALRRRNHHSFPALLNPLLHKRNLWNIIASCTYSQSCSLRRAAVVVGRCGRRKFTLRFPFHNAQDVIASSGRVYGISFRLILAIAGAVGVVVVNRSARPCIQFAAVLSEYPLRATITPILSLNGQTQRFPHWKEHRLYSQ